MLSNSFYMPPASVYEQGSYRAKDHPTLREEAFLGVMCFSDFT